MLETFSKYCSLTMNEIYEASVKSSGKGPVDAEKLLKKVVQFFPNIVISVDEIKSAPAAKLSELLQSRWSYFLTYDFVGLLSRIHILIISFLFMIG